MRERENSLILWFSTKCNKTKRNIKKKKKTITTTTKGWNSGILDWNSNAQASVDAYALSQNFVEECQHMNEMTKSHFHESSSKKQVRLHESAKGKKNAINIRLCFQQVHPSKVRIIIHIC